MTPDSVPPVGAERVFNGPTRPLFERYPRLRERIPIIELAELPTPVRRLARLGDAIGAGSLWLKDDGPSSVHYGGNKVRKLELLLAAAKARGARSVMTFGYAGSNHATATAVHAARAGLSSISMLLPQHNAAYLQKNLLVSSAARADIHEYASESRLAAAAVWHLARRALGDRALPFLIAPGGSSELGTIGFVNAAFELAQQIDEGLLPRPEKVYAAGGSLGTVVGLAIGFAALELPIHVVGVRVVDERFVNPSRAQALRRKTVRLLRSHDPTFPDVGDDDGRMELRGEFYGGVYARETPESEEARTMALDVEGLDLDVTYTAKTLACLVSDARKGMLASAPVLFWNTASTADVTALASRAGIGDLPARLRRYYETGG